MNKTKLEILNFVIWAKLFGLLRFNFKIFKLDLIWVQIEIFRDSTEDIKM